MRYILVALTIFLISCVSPVIKLAKIEAKHPQLFAQRCADAFPVKEKTVVQFKPGKTDTLTQTSYSHDTVFITKTHRVIDTILSETTVENTAKVNALQLSLNAAHDAIVAADARHVVDTQRLKDANTTIGLWKRRTLGIIGCLIIVGLAWGYTKFASPLKLLRS